MRSRMIVAVLFATTLAAGSPVFAADAPGAPVATATESATTVPVAAIPDVAEVQTGVPQWLLSATPSLATLPASISLSLDGESAQTTPRRPLAFEYSDAYMTRRKIHVWASYATLPLFAVEYIMGTKLWDDPYNKGVRDTHRYTATAVAGLFGVNTVTGVWNMWEGRKDPAGRKKRMIHSFMMLGADAGFALTGALAPSLVDGGGNRDLHRSVALTSMGVATASYLFMLFSH